MDYKKLDTTFDKMNPIYNNVNLYNPNSAGYNNIVFEHHEPKYTSFIDNLKNSNLIREIDKINYDLEWESQQLKEKNDKLKSLENSNGLKKGLQTLIYATFSGILFPFIILIYYCIINDVFGENVSFNIAVSIFSAVLLVMSLVFICAYLISLSKSG